MTTFQRCKNYIRTLLLKPNWTRAFGRCFFGEIKFVPFESSFKYSCNKITIFFGERSQKLGYFFVIWSWMGAPFFGFDAFPKNGWPLLVSFYYPQQIGNYFRKWRLKSAFTKKTFEEGVPTGIPYYIIQTTLVYFETESTNSNQFCCQHTNWSYSGSTEQLYSSIPYPLQTFHKARISSKQII